MKMLPTLLSTLILSASLNGISHAAIEVTHSDSADLNKIKSVSVTGCGTANDAVESVRKLAESTQADYYHISRLDVPGDGSKWSANAALYSVKNGSAYD